MNWVKNTSCKFVLAWSLLFSTFFSGIAQPSVVRTYRGLGSVSVDRVEATDSFIWVAGRFQQDLHLQDTLLNSKGEEDLFLVRESISNEQFLVWSGGSNLDESWGDIFYDENTGDLIAGGSFWRDLAFGDTLIQASGNPKALFVCRFSSTGSVRWVRSISGGSLKELSGLAMLPEGDLVVSGFFADSLQIGDTTMYSMAASSGFVLGFSGEGKLMWAQVLGNTGNTHLTAMATAPDGALYVAGWYDDQLSVGDSIIFSNTSDRDVFLMRFSAFGQPIWLEKAGGVFDEEPTDLIVDPFGYPLLAGFMVGRMTLNGKIDIESADGNSDAFLLRYYPTGKLDWAKVLSGDQLQAATAVAADLENIFLAGEFQQNIRADNLNLNGKGLYDGFLARLDSTGAPTGLDGYSSQDLLLPTTLATGTLPGTVWMGGSYRGYLPWMSNQNHSPNKFAGFLTAISSPVTSTGRSNFTKMQKEITVFPNPTGGTIYLPGLPDNTVVTLINGNGWPVWQGTINKTEITLPEMLPGGHYHLWYKGQKTAPILLVLIR